MVELWDSIDHHDDIALDVYEPGGEEKRETQWLANGVASSTRLDDSKEFRNRFDAQVGGPKATDVEIGRVESRVTFRDFDQVQRPTRGGWSERLVRG